MRQGEAVLLMNMFVAELGYTVEWITSPDNKRAETFLLRNDEGDMREFAGDDMLEQAVNWLRQKL